MVPNTKYSNRLDDYIVVFDNIISDELSDRILEEYGNSIYWQDGLVGTGVIDKNYRDVDIVGMSFPQIIQENFAVRKQLDNDVFECANLAIRKYNEKFPEARIQQDSGYELLRYNTGQKYEQHTDSFRERNRAVSCSFMLNDDYLGGEFAFFNRKLKYKLPKGSVLMFPSNFMYPHEIMPVTKGTRYSIITWFV